MRASYEEILDSFKSGSPQNLRKHLEGMGWTFDEFLHETRQRYVPDYFKKVEKKS